MKFLIQAICIMCATVYLSTMYASYAQVMQSSNYSINFDSINSGGVISSSTNYGTEDTLGELSTGDSSSTNYSISAGYQQNDTYFIAISVAPNLTLSSISGIGANQASGTASWNVSTNDPVGYSLYIRSTSSPSLKATTTNSSFADYVPTGASPDYAFTVGAASSTFGFSPEGNDIVSRYKDNGSACNTGSGNNTNTCYDGLSTTDRLISSVVAANYPIGATTTVRFVAGVGSSKIQDAANYQATVIVTAIAP